MYSFLLVSAHHYIITTPTCVSPAAHLSCDARLVFKSLVLELSHAYVQQKLLHIIIWRIRL